MKKRKNPLLMKLRLPLDEAEMLDEILDILKSTGGVVDYTIGETNPDEATDELVEAILSIQFKDSYGAFCFGQMYVKGQIELGHIDKFVHNHYHRFGFDEGQHTN